MNIFKSAPVWSLIIITLTLFFITIYNLLGNSIDIAQLANKREFILLHIFLLTSIIVAGFMYSWFYKQYMPVTLRSAIMLISLLIIISGAILGAYNLLYTYLGKFQVILEVAALNYIKYVTKTITPTVVALSLAAYLIIQYSAGYYLLKLGNWLYFVIFGQKPQ